MREDRLFPVTTAGTLTIAAAGRFRARSDKMDTIPAFAGKSFSEKSSLKQTDADQDRFHVK
jgi:hypothetical protein